MANRDNIQGVTYEAASDLSGSQFCFVTLNSDGQIALTTEGALADGVLQDAPAAKGRGADVHVARGFKCPVKTGGSFAVGDSVISDSTGRAIKNASTADNILGKAVEASGGADQIVTIIFQPSVGV